MSKIDDLRKLDTQKLDEKLNEQRKGLVEKKMILATGSEKNVSVVRKLKKQIARINTVIREKEILNEQ